MKAKKKSRLSSAELTVQQEQWPDVLFGISESFVDYGTFSWPTDENSFEIEKMSFSGELVHPFVELVDDLPVAPLPSTIPKGNVKRTDLQIQQAKELFEHLTQSGMSREKALKMMGPLASEITKYRRSFSISEARWTVRGLIGKRMPDRPFMAPVKK